MRYHKWCIERAFAADHRGHEHGLRHVVATDGADAVSKLRPLVQKYLGDSFDFGDFRFEYRFNTIDPDGTFYPPASSTFCGRYAVADPN